MTARVFLHVFSTFQAAGPQLRTIEIIKALGSGLQHLILAMDGHTEAARLLPDDLTVSLLPEVPKAGSVLTTWRLVQLLRETRPDLLLTYNFGAIDALLAARMRRGPPAIHHEDGFLPDEVNGLKWRRSLLRQVALPAARRVVVVSKQLETIALRKWRQTPGRVQLIPNGIDLPRFKHCTDRGSVLRSRLGLSKKDFVIGTVGHLRPEKGHTRLLAAAALANREGISLHVLLAGDGPERGVLEDLAGTPELQGKVHFLGHIRYPEEAYGAMDLYALTSDTEQMPISLLEAMAAGLPVVATDVGDVRRMLPAVQFPEIVAVNENTIERLAERFIAHARDREKRDMLRLANSTHVSQLYSLETMVERYRALYEETLGASLR